MSPDGRSGRRPRSIDPQGKRALFETPVEAAPDSLSSRSADGKAALFSTGPAEPGTVVVECSGCQVRSRVSLMEVGLRLLQGSVWLPFRRHGRLMRCPACGDRRWCRVHWLA